MYPKDKKIDYDEYLRIVEDLGDKLKESVVLNNSFAKIINIIKSNPETVDRLDDILERFNTVETVEEGNQLYETISNEVKSDKNQKIKQRIMIYNYETGENNGIEWSVDLDDTEGIWIVTASDGKTTRTEKFDWAHQPIWGMVDIVDSERLHETVDRLTEPKRNRLKDWFRKIFKNR